MHSSGRAMSWLFGVVLLLPLTGSAPAETVHQEARSQSTRAVTAADGTTTTTITEKVTRDGRTTTTRRTVVTKPGEAEPPPRRSPAGERPGEDARAGKRDSAELAREAVEAHNRERRQHGVGDLSWDPKLTALAEQWAHHLCRGGKSPPMLQHRPAGGAGENLWEAVTTENTRYTVTDAVKSWAGEQRYYNERSGRCQGGTCGHYTQLVWRNTKQVGCAIKSCPAGAFTATICVCNYTPAGNFANERPY